MPDLWPYFTHSSVGVLPTVRIEPSSAVAQLASWLQARSFLEHPSLAGHLARPSNKSSGRTPGSLRARARARHGGMATVYLAHDLQARAEGSVKVLRPELVPRPRPPSASARSRSPPTCTIPISSRCTTQGGRRSIPAPSFITHALRPKGNRCATRLTARTAPPRRTRCASRARWRTPGYAHGRGVILGHQAGEHLLRAGHAWWRTSASRWAVASGRVDRLTEDGTRGGTPAYMSPEQAAGERDLMGAVISSLGALLYEMLAGQPPFTGPKESIVRQHLTAYSASRHPAKAGGAGLWSPRPSGRRSPRARRIGSIRVGSSRRPWRFRRDGSASRCRLWTAGHRAGRAAAWSPGHRAGAALGSLGWG